MVEFCAIIDYLKYFPLIPTLTMILKIVANIKTRGKEAVNVIKAKLVAVLHYILTFACSVHAAIISMLIVYSNLRNAQDAEKRYRLTSDHSPVFSLFSFFPDHY